MRKCRRTHSNRNSILPFIYALGHYNYTTFITTHHGFLFALYWIKWILRSGCKLVKWHVKCVANSISRYWRVVAIADDAQIRRWPQHRVIYANNNLYIVVCKWFPNQVRRISTTRADDHEATEERKRKKKWFVCGNRENWRRTSCPIYLLILIQMQNSQDLIVLENN